MIDDICHDSNKRTPPQNYTCKWHVWGTQLWSLWMLLDTKCTRGVDTEGKKVNPYVLKLSITYGDAIITLRINSSSPGQIDRYFANDILKCIFVNEKMCISIRISPKLVLTGPIKNKPAVVQVMTWRRSGDKPLPEPILTQVTDAYMRH